MYIIRTAFWLSLIVFLLPIGEETPDRASTSDAQQSSLSAGDALGAAMSTVEDVAGLCERKPHICEAGSAAWDTFQRKARYGVRAIYQWANGDDVPAEGRLSPRVPVEPKEDRSAGAIDFTAPFQVSGNTEPLHTGTVHPGTVNPGTPADTSTAGRPDSQNTLTIEDLIPEWSGPGRKTRA